MRWFPIGVARAELAIAQDQADQIPYWNFKNDAKKAQEAFAASRAATRAEANAEFDARMTTRAAAQE